MLQGFKRVLIASPHTDDAEWGCGGTIAKLVSAGAEIVNMIFSTAEDTLPPPFTTQDRIAEAYESAHKLRIRLDPVFRMWNRRFFESRAEILDLLVGARDFFKPDLVFCPATTDTHQDHEVIASETIRAFKTSATILGYEIPWNNLTFSPTCLVGLNRGNLDAKLNALRCYESCKSAWHFKLPGVVEALARVRGLQMKTDFAEGFEVIRWVVR